MNADQNNQWNRTFNGQTSESLTEKGPLSGNLSWFAEGLIGLEGRNDHCIFSNSIGVGGTGVNIDQQMNVVASPDAFITAPGDRYQIKLNRKLLMSGRSTLGYVFKSHYFAAGITMAGMQLSQQRGQNQPDLKWTIGAGPCLSFKVDLAKHFRWVFYGDMLFFNPVKAQLIFREGEPVTIYNVKFNRDPFIWRISTGFEVHFTKKSDCPSPKKLPYMDCPRYQKCPVKKPIYYSRKKSCGCRKSRR